MKLMNKNDVVCLMAGMLTTAVGLVAGINLQNLKIEQACQQHQIIKLASKTMQCVSVADKMGKSYKQG